MRQRLSGWPPSTAPAKRKLAGVTFFRGESFIQVHQTRLQAAEMHLDPFRIQESDALSRLLGMAHSDKRASCAGAARPSRSTNWQTWRQKRWVGEGLSALRQVTACASSAKGTAFCRGALATHARRATDRRVAGGEHSLHLVEDVLACLAPLRFWPRLVSPWHEWRGRQFRAIPADGKRE